MNDLLFVYGTLLLQHNSFADYMRKNCTFVSEGKVKGQLYDLGDYPGLTIGNMCGYVYGNLYRMANPTRILKELDFYEGVGETQEQPNLYRRDLKTTYTNDGQFDAWVYIYNLPVDKRNIITCGDYRKHLGQKKSPGS
jgi:gamma-glutamylcyclotransferase (GGCT)/AIG2-like uncharacterized protein YtfP